jgi:hypothetical protein
VNDDIPPPSTAAVAGTVYDGEGRPIPAKAVDMRRIALCVLVDDDGIATVRGNGKASPDQVAEWLANLAGVQRAQARELAAAQPARPGYVYVASSWRNAVQPAVVQALRAAGLDVYDFRNPAEGDNGFRWTDVDPEWAPVIGSGDGGTTAESYLRAIEHPVARDGYAKDFAAMQRADTFVLVLPCGRSAHLELGWAVGAGKRTAILMEDPCVPELMYRMVDYLAPSLLDLLGWLGVEDSPAEAS